METVVFTGTLKSMPRKKAEILAHDIGWCVSKKITRSTTAVVVGTMGNSRLHGEDSDKFKKAKSKGIRLISENEFLSIVE